MPEGWVLPESARSFPPRLQQFPIPQLGKLPLRAADSLPCPPADWATRAWCRSEARANSSLHRNSLFNSEDTGIAPTIRPERSLWNGTRGGIRTHTADGLSVVPVPKTGMDTSWVGGSIPRRRPIFPRKRGWGVEGTFSASRPGGVSGAGKFRGSLGFLRYLLAVDELLRRGHEPSPESLHRSFSSASRLARTQAGHNSRNRKNLR